MDLSTGNFYSDFVELKQKQGQLNTNTLQLNRAVLKIIYRTGSDLGTDKFKTIIIVYIFAITSLGEISSSPIPITEDKMMHTKVKVSSNNKIKFYLLYFHYVAILRSIHQQILLLFSFESM